MYTLRIKGEFDAAHYLPHYSGKCSRMHGHSWIVEAFFLATKQDDIGISIDFKLLKNELGRVLDKLDHTELNQIIEQPTAENIARYIYGKLVPKPIKVVIWEGRNSAVEYKED